MCVVCVCINVQAEKRHKQLKVAELALMKELEVVKKKEKENEQRVNSYRDVHCLFQAATCDCRLC